jgi:hypothetical protein
MSRADVTALFAKVGASAATVEANKDSVGEFGIGVISYFMAGDTFDLQTNNGESEPVGLSFSKEMLAGKKSDEIPLRAHRRAPRSRFTYATKQYSISSEHLPALVPRCRGLSAR